IIAQTPKFVKTMKDFRMKTPAGNAIGSLENSFIRLRKIMCHKTPDLKNTTKDETSNEKCDRIF
ncbi:3879_t:CDS:1, partial [Gigaspora rosea]